MLELLPGSEVKARGLRLVVILSECLGPQTLFRLKGLEGEFRGKETDLLHPFEPIEPVINELRPRNAGRLTERLVYHKAFLLEPPVGSMRTGIAGYTGKRSECAGPFSIPALHLSWKSGKQSGQGI
jgi:hypothetical protein